MHQDDGSQDSPESTYLLRRLQQTAATVVETMKVDLVFVWEALPGGSRAVLHEAGGQGRGIPGGGLLTEIEPGSQAHFGLRAGQPVYVADLPAERRFRPNPLLVRRGAISGVSVPIVEHGHVIGLLDAYTTRPRVFGRGEVLFLEAIAAILAQAIRYDRVATERSRLAWNHQTLVERLQVMAQGLQNIALAPSGDVTSRMLGLTWRAVDVTDVCYFRYDPQTNGLGLEAVADPDPLSPELVERARRTMVFEWGCPKGLVGLVARTHEGLYVPDTHLERYWESAWTDVRSAYMAPVFFGSRTYGVLQLLSVELGGISPEQRSLADVAGACMAAVLQCSATRDDAPQTREPAHRLSLPWQTGRVAPGFTREPPGP